MRTPPGVTDADFASAVQEFANIVGKEWVFTSDEDLDLYRDAYSPVRGLPTERLASGAVAPYTTEQVQAVVRTANKYKIPIYAISTGKNLGYGGAAPAYSGSVVLDLKRMNRIIEVNDTLHYAVVEPGVSYFDFYDYIQKNKLKVWLDCPDPGWGSLMGNALDHGVGYTQGRFRNHFDSHCGMEVVLANGELLRTGMGALPNSKSWQQFNLGFGPILDGIFSQSNFGVVTKMGFWLLPQPEAYMQGSIYASDYDDFHAVLELYNLLDNSGVVTGLTTISSPLLGQDSSEDMMARFAGAPSTMPRAHRELIAGTEMGYSSALAKYGKDNNIPYWELGVSFYGSPKFVSAQFDAACEMALKKIPKATFKPGTVYPLPMNLVEGQARGIHPPQLGIPNLDMFIMGSRNALNRNPNDGHLFFAPMVPQTADAILECNRVLRDAASRLKVPIGGLRPLALPITQFPRSFFMLFGFPVIRDAAVNRPYIEAYSELTKICAEHGWGEYRTPTYFQDEAMGVYSYNNNILRRFNEVLKDAVDPNGILSPGRYGIWPAHLRRKS